MAAPAARWSPTACAGNSTPTTRTSTSSIATIATCTKPGLLFVPFGLTSLKEIVRPGTRQFRDGIVPHEREIEKAGDGEIIFI